MTERCLRCLFVLALVMLGCEGRRAPPRSKGEQVQRAALPSLHPDTSQTLGLFLKKQGIELDSVIGSADDYYVVTGWPQSAQPRVRALFIVVKQEGSRFVPLDSLTVGEFIPSVTWQRQQFNHDRLLVLTFDDRGEDMVFTRVYGINPAKSAVIFVDKPGTCVPARVVDLNGDGQAEIVSYSEAPEGCLSACIDRLKQVTGLSAYGWPEISNPVAPISSEEQSRYASFYRRMADEFSRAADWVKANGGQWACNSEGIEPAQLMDWSRRAGERAGG